MEHLVKAVSYTSAIFVAYLLSCQVRCNERKELIGVAMFNKFDDRTKQIAIIEDFSRFFSEVINAQQRILSNLFESWEILCSRNNFSYIDNPHARFIPMPELFVVEKFEMVTRIEPVYALLKRSHQRSLTISTLAAEHNSELRNVCGDEVGKFDNVIGRIFVELDFLAPTLYLGCEKRSQEV